MTPFMAGEVGGAVVVAPTDAFGRVFREAVTRRG